MAKKNQRFTVIYSQSSFSGGTQILVDRKTGVHYLFCKVGYGAGLTPLLDREGKPVITPRPVRGVESEAAAGTDSGKEEDGEA